MDASKPACLGQPPFDRLPWAREEKLVKAPIPSSFSRRSTRPLVSNGMDMSLRFEETAAFFAAHGNDAGWGVTKGPGRPGKREETAGYGTC
jgi:hypothetical protein